jgi:hypothetical protein
MMSLCTCHDMLIKQVTNKESLLTRSLNKTQEMAKIAKDLSHRITSTNLAFISLLASS